MAGDGSSGSENRSNSEGKNYSAVVSLLWQSESLLSSQVHRNAATVSPPCVETSISSDRSLANFRSLFACVIQSVVLQLLLLAYEMGG